MPIQDQPRILVVQNSEGSSLGRFEAWWAEDGLDVTIIKAYDGEVIPDLADFDALVMLGGGLMPDADEKAPWLVREREVAAVAIETQLPLLGICLGGQLLAHVGGGTVQAEHGAPESGSTELTRRDDAVGDRLFGPLPPNFLAMEHRVDAITELPKDAVWLASSEACPIQGFRIGDRAWGLQFHPEIGAERVARWDRDSLIQQGYDPDEVVRAAEAAEPTVLPIWRAFANRFAQVVHGDRSARAEATE